MTRRGGYGFAPTDLPLLLVLLSAGLAAWPAHGREASWPAFAALAAGLAVSALLSRLRPNGPWRFAAGAVVAASALLSLYFVTQYRHLGYAEKLPVVDHLAALAGMLAPSLGSWAPDRNSVGTFLEGPAFLAAGLALASRGKMARIAWSAATVAIAAGLVVSASRGAWIAVAASAAVWLVIERRWFVTRPGAAPLAAAIPLLAGLAWLAAVVWWPDATGSGAIAPALDRPDRVALYRASAVLVGDYPYTGLGLGGPFAMLLSRYVLLIQVPFLTYSHNLYLETWLQLGLAGAAAMAALLTAFFLTFAAFPQLRQRTLAQASGMGVLAALLHGLVDARQYVDPWTAVPVFVLLGLAASMVRPALTAPVRRQARIWSAAAAASLVGATMVATWPPHAAWQSNLGAARQAGAELGGGAGDAGAKDGLAAAEAHFRTALALAPGQRTANLRLALIEMADGRFDPAAGHAEAAWKADRSSVATRKAFGLACVWTGDLERAQPLLRGLPGMVEELNAWGWWRASRQETALAQRAYRASLALAPDQEPVRRALAELERTPEPEPPAAR